jgi:hypothetical protein
MLTWLTEAIVGVAALAAAAAVVYVVVSIMRAARLIASRIGKARLFVIAIGPGRRHRPRRAARPVTASPQKHREVLRER